VGAAAVIIVFEDSAPLVTVTHDTANRAGMLDMQRRAVLAQRTITIAKCQ
jgi:hypothetical protein